MSAERVVEAALPATCSKRLGRGLCKRPVVFYAEMFGKRDNACVVHLGDVLMEQGIYGTVRASVHLRLPSGSPS